MKDYSAMSDYLINKQVAESLTGRYLYFSDYVWDSEEEVRFNPCNYPADAWPIIYVNGISIGIYGYGEWGAGTVNHNHVDGVNPLRSAMIVYLMMKDAEKCDG